MTGYCCFKGQSQPSVSAASVPTHLLSHILAALQVVVTVWENLRLHNGHDAMLGGAQQGRALSGGWKRTQKPAS